MLEELEEEKEEEKELMRFQECQEQEEEYLYSVVLEHVLQVGRRRVVAQGATSFQGKGIVTTRRA